MDDGIPSLVADEVQSHLGSYGVHGAFGDLVADEPIPKELTLSDGRRLGVDALYSPKVSLRSTRIAADQSSRQLLIITHHIHPSTAESLRAGGIWFADASGNSFLRAPNVTIDVRCRTRSRRVSMVRGRAADTRATTLFTPKRAQVVAAILSTPELVAAPLRDIAFRAGTSVGLAKSTMDDLAEVGFVAARGTSRRPVDFERLLDMWVSAFPIGLGESVTLFVGEGEPHPTVSEGVDVAVSGEQAVPALIRHAPTLTAYVELDPGERLPAAFIRANRWRKSDLPNVVLRRKFWRDLPEFRPGCAPAPLVIADLVATRDGRQLEAAKEVRAEWSASSTLIASTTRT